MLVREDLIRNVRGSGEMEKYGERSFLPREDTEMANMPGMQGGILWGR